MENEYTYSLVVAVGGVQLPGENTKTYLARVAETAGVGFYALRRAFYGEYVSKKVISKLEQAAKDARQADAAIASTEYYLKIWERNPELYRPWIDAAREFLDALHRYPETPGDFDLAARTADVGEGTP